MKYVRVLRQRIWLIILCPVIAAIAAAIVSSLLPPVYEAHVVLLVRPSQPLGSADPTTTALTSDQISRTYASLMIERPLLETVRGDLAIKLSTSDLAKKIKVTPEASTTLIDVSAQDTDPALARDLANKLVADFVVEIKQIQQQETQLPNARSGDNLVVVSPAVIPERPVSPNLLLNVAVALAAGLLLALGLSFLMDYLDQSIKDDEELIDRTGFVPLGHVPFTIARSGPRRDLLSLDEQSGTAEAYKALRTALLFSTIDQQLKTIVVTSARPGEGKSRTAGNLAVVLAGAGHKTVLVDADLRRPSAHRIFGRVRNIGLSNLMLQDVPEVEAVTPVESIPNLWLITSGALPPNPSELLGSSRMREVMGRLKDAFTYVIIDTPPVNAVTDAPILASYADGTILVVEQGATTFPALKHAKQALDRVGANTLGVVMNKVKSSGFEAYDYGSYAPARHEPGTHVEGLKANR